eukprot:c5032_g1_i1.p1 GENE.c5032_g1_i1~~c5032_g1_i1.p1  ORF type:complete len:120 (+),score=20.76 c5032_g1_i1:354-713(+)
MPGSVIEIGSSSDESTGVFESSRKKKRKKPTRSRPLACKTQQESFSFEQILEQERQHLLPPGAPCYTSAAAGPPIKPPIQFCAVCGYFSKYTCTVCGARYCCPRCFGTHKDTRCLKFTA